MGTKARQSRAEQLAINRMLKYNSTLCRHGILMRVEFEGDVSELPSNCWVGYSTVQRLLETCWLQEIESTKYETRWTLTDEGRCAADETDVDRAVERKRSA